MRLPRISISKDFIKQDSIFHGRRQLRSMVKDVFHQMTPPVRRRLERNLRGIRFETQAEHTLFPSLFPSKSGFFDVDKREIHMFALNQPGARHTSYRVNTPIVRERGYDARKYGLAYELGHAYSVRGKEDFTRTMDRFEKLSFKSKSPKDYITEYARSDSLEDYADTFGYYALHRRSIDKQLDRGSRHYATDVLRDKFRFMRQEWERRRRR